MKKKKGILSSILSFVIVGAVVIFVFLPSFGKIFLTKAISDVVGVPVSIGSLKIDPFKGEAGISKLEFNNPKGFKEKHLASIPEIFVTFDLKSFFVMKPHIYLIRINLENITVEKGKGTSFNLMELKAMKDIYEYREPPAGGYKPEKQKKPAPPMEMKIDLLDFSLGSARYCDHSGTQPVVKELPLNVSHFQVKNLTNPAQVVQQIVNKTMSKIGSAVLGVGLDQLKLTAQQKLAEVKSSIGNWFQKKN